MVGYIYIFTNPAYPNLVKIGYANNWKERLKTLNSSPGVPYAFRCFATYKVNTRLTDKSLFHLIDQLNPNLRTKDEIDGKKRVREFFKMTSNEALNIIDAIAKITGTTKNIEVIKKTSDDIKEEKRVNEDRRPPFKFSMIGMGKGDKIFFRNDNKKIATVVDENHVKYENNIYSLTALAKKLGKFSGAIPGPLYFTDSRGIALSDLRKEKEQ